MTKMMHFRMVGVASAVTLLAAVAGPASNAMAQSGAAPASPAVPVPTPMPPPAEEPVPGPATSDAPSAVPLVAPTLAPTLTTPEASASSITSATTEAPQPLLPDVDDGEHGPKSPAAATGYAVLGALSGPVLLGLAAAVPNGNRGSDQSTLGLGLLSVVGFLAGPSAGRWYAGELGGGPLLARCFGSGLVLLGAASVRGGPENLLPFLVAVGGVGSLVVVTAIYDVATAGDRAREYNRNHRSRGGANLTFAPLVQRSEGRTGTMGTTTGLMLGGSF
ncbi:MAG: hypothetical protein KBG15_21575 [Kofleriaceae bacterium]|nr:hypothetical protein [Kofleriaceae bacterium]